MPCDIYCYRCYQNVRSPGRSVNITMRILVVLTIFSFAAAYAAGSPVQDPEEKRQDPQAPDQRLEASGGARPIHGGADILAPAPGSGYVQYHKIPYYGPAGPYFLGQEPLPPPVAFQPGGAGQGQAVPGGGGGLASKETQPNKDKDSGIKKPASAPEVEVDEK